MNRISRPSGYMFTVVVIATATDTQYLALQANWIGILVLGYKRVFQFVSAAKNAVAFFRMSRSICNRFTSAFRDLISCCSVLNFPLPRKA